MLCELAKKNKIMEETTYYTIGYKVSNGTIEGYRYPPQWGQFETRQAAIDYVRKRDIETSDFEVTRFNEQVETFNLS